MLKDQRLHPAGCTALHNKTRASIDACWQRPLKACHLFTGRALNCRITA